MSETSDEELEAFVGTAMTPEDMIREYLPKFKGGIYTITANIKKITDMPTLKKNKEIIIYNIKKVSVICDISECNIDPPTEGLILTDYSNDFNEAIRTFINDDINNELNKILSHIRKGNIFTMKFKIKL